MNGKTDKDTLDYICKDCDSIIDRHEAQLFNGLCETCSKEKWENDYDIPNWRKNHE